MADVILMELSKLTFAQLQQRRTTRQRQLREYSHFPMIVATAQNDLDAIEAEKKKRSAATKARVRPTLRLVPNPEP